MPDNTFKIIFLFFFISGCIIRAVCLFRIPQWWRKKQEIIVNRKSALEKLLMLLMIPGMQVLPLVYVFSAWLDFADYHMPVFARQITGWFGTAVFTAALWLLWRSHADLGQNFSPEIQLREEHSLVTRGVFQYIRHPMYAAHFLWAIAQALLLQNWLAGPVMLASFLLLYFHRVQREEQMMLEHFGE